ncbi:LOW QUALITY PROTEIN: cyclic AMP-dependent transcription factor ATF-3 [Gallus gallus]|uniref:LOW QUALITY PROTEIN: cyclic AMP-dependent transcription factor ATF-3 n=1 Tax=Gallus gallus TaxID=9031 RepID=UPI001F029243|nr:LOW QUALITY PROTEIN: cyclic AMP-dependent transcription factor ATF-3 [Gallus gallus]
MPFKINLSGYRRLLHQHRRGRNSCEEAKPRERRSQPSAAERKDSKQNDGPTHRPGVCIGSQRLRNCPHFVPAGSLGFDDFTNLTPLVKEELRFAIQNKRQSHRMSSTLDTVTVSERPMETSIMKTEFSPEEDERKKRRRERNKIAAAKCRNKKKEKTECLQKESEKLETINAELKAQIEELKNEKQHLIYMLNLHRPTCIVRAQNGRTPEDERNLFIQQIKEGTLQG